MTQLLQFENVKFSYDNAVSPLLTAASLSFASGWTGIIGANGAGKTTTLKLAMGILKPIQGRVIRQGKGVYCPQRTDDPPELFQEFLNNLQSEACILRSRLGIHPDWFIQWNYLSHGERKRAQIATALWQEPDILAIDEPTNHIDQEARELLLQTLKNYNGVGLLVSHDRDLLDSLCRQCVLLDPPDIFLSSGGYTRTMQYFQEQENKAINTHEQIKTRMTQLVSEVQRRKDVAEKMRRNSTKRKLAPGDRDGRVKIDAARVSGKDIRMSQLAKQLSGRISQEEQQLARIRIKPRYDTEFWFQVKPARMDYLFRMAVGSLELGDGRVLEYPELELKPNDRIALTGPNGSGKSSLVRKIYAEMIIEPDKVVYLPQEISLLQTQQMMQEVHSLPEDRLGNLMTLVSCLGTRPERLLSNQEVSPGEIRKILLARGVQNAPYLIMMDEPTNHLDFPAIECLESALSKCPCALLLVSHDERFLSAVGTVRWELSPIPKQNKIILNITTV